MPTNRRVIVRSKDAGVFFGRLLEIDKHGTVTMIDPRRLWYWDGAATLSELAVEGTSEPGNCKFPIPTDGTHTILGVCEIIPVTDKAADSIDDVPVWSKH